MNRVRSKVAGYTIVETMIFLAVSGLLFASAMLLVNGQQAKTEFTNQVRDFDSKLQSVISNVSNGYYNSTGDITCTVIAGVIDSIMVGGGTKQGQNSDCTYIGQWISIPTAPSNDKFIITSYAGLRRNSSDEEVSSLSEASPTAITETAEEYNLLSGVTATMKTKGTSSAPFSTLAITTTFNAYDSDGLTSGSAKAQYYAYDSGGGPVTIQPEGIQICLTDGTRYGDILLTTGSTSVTQGMGSTCP